MNSRWQVRFLWVAAVLAVVIVSAVPEHTRLGVLVASHLANSWVLFLACAATAALPSVTWRFRTWLLSCLVFACALVCGLPHLLFSWPFGRADRILPDLFGIAAGVLLGLNVRMSLNPIGAVSGGKRKQEQSAMISGAPLESRAPLSLHDAVGKEQP